MDIGIGYRLNAEDLRSPDIAKIHLKQAYVLEMRNSQENALPLVQKYCQSVEFCNRTTDAPCLTT